MAVVDFLAWQIVRFIGLLQGTIYNLLSRLSKSRSIEDKAKYIGGSMAGFVLFNSKPEDFPGIMRDRLLLIGRILLVFIVFSSLAGLTSQGGC